MTIAEKKRKQREQIWEAQKALNEETRQASDFALFQMLRQLEQWRTAKVIFLFLGIPPEPDTQSLLEDLWYSNVKTAIPLCFGNGYMEPRLITGMDQLEEGRYGMLEPTEACPIVEKQEISLILTPAVCFDRGGHRIGRGGGYYDRFLQGYTGCSVGLCRSQFVQSWIPTESHDQAVNFIVTETEIIHANEC